MRPLCDSSTLTPPVRATHMLNFDPEVMSVAIQDGRLEHVQLECGQFSGQIAHTATFESWVDWGCYTLSVLARGDLSRDRVTIAMALQGKGDWRLQGVGAFTGDIVVFPESGELLAALPPHAQWLTVQVSAARLDAAGLLSSAHNARQVRRIHAGNAPELYRTLSNLAPVLAPVPNAETYDAKAVAWAHDQLVDSLFAQLAHAGVAMSMDAPLAPTERHYLVRRAELFLEGREDQSVRMEEVCQASGTSLSRLERAFRETFGVSPHRYLTLRRLAAVRRELLRQTPSVSITDVATRWGFFHLGRFSQDYKALFAELPSQTLRARRQ
jgi:AraC family ethanolamine operon transcriptional activator